MESPQQQAAAREKRVADHTRLVEIVTELWGISEELGQLDSESAGLLKRKLDDGLRASPEPNRQQPGG